MIRIKASKVYFLLNLSERCNGSYYLLLSGNGICKISAETLADKANCSVRTVTDTVRALKQTGEILVAGLADGKNKYVFVLKTHPNFTTILKEVFYINAYQIAERTAEQVAEQKT